MGRRVLVPLILEPPAASAASADPVDHSRKHQGHDHAQSKPAVVTMQYRYVVAGQICAGAPEPHPQRGSDDVEHQESRPWHAQGSGQDPIELPQPLHETCTYDHPGSVAVEEAFPMFQTLLVHQLMAAQVQALPHPQDEPPPSEVSDGKAHVVAQNSGNEPDYRHDENVEITLARGDGGHDQHRLTGGGKAEVLGEDGQGDRWVTEIGHELCDIHAAYTTPALASRWANLSGRYATLDVCRERAQQKCSARDLSTQALA